MRHFLATILKQNGDFCCDDGNEHINVGSLRKVVATALLRRFHEELSKPQDRGAVRQLTMELRLYKRFGAHNLEVADVALDSIKEPPL